MPGIGLSIGIGHQSHLGLGGGGPAAPTAAGGIADQSYPEDIAIVPLNVAADFTGTGITYALAPSSAALPVGLSLSSAGLLTGTPTTPAAAAIIVVRGTNAGGFADTAFDITVTVSGAAFATTTLSVVDHGGVSVPLQSPAPVGSFWTRSQGKFVVAGAGTVTFNAPTPDYTATPRPMNGAMVNYGSKTKQGFDQWMDNSEWDAAQRATFPITLSAGDTLTIERGNLTVANEDRDGVRDDMCVIHVVASAPLMSKNAPIVDWPVPATRPVPNDIAPAILAAASPRASATGITIPSWASIKDRLDKAQFTLAMMDATTVGGYQSGGLSYRFGDYGSGENYGVGWAEMMHYIITGAILTDFFAEPDALEAIRVLASHGFEWGYGFMQRGKSRGSDGGHYNVIGFETVMPAHFAGDTTLRDYCLANTLGNLNMGKRITASWLHQVYNPHNSGSAALIGRVRLCGAGTGGTPGGSGVVYVQQFPTDPGNWSIEKMMLVRLSDGATATVVTSSTLDEANPTAYDSVTVTYAGPVFADGDQIVIRPPVGVDFRIGDPIWTPGSDLRTAIVSPLTSYSTLQARVIPLCAWVKLGLPITPQIETELRLLQAHMTANYPAASFDWPLFAQQTYESAYWTNHGQAIIAAAVSALSTDATAPVLSGLDVQVLSSSTVRLRFTSSEAGVGALLVITNSATKPTPTQLRTRKDNAGAIAPYFMGMDVGDTSEQRTILSIPSPGASLHLHLMLADNSRNESLVESKSFTMLASGYGFPEDWYGLAAGAAEATILAQNGGYAESSTAMVTSAVAKASAPNGVGIQIFRASTTPCFITSAVVTAECVANPSSIKELMVEMDLNASVAGARFASGVMESNLVTGVTFGRTSGGWQIGAVLAGDPNATASNLLSNAANGIYRVRLRYDGVLLRGRIWLRGAAEPTTWVDLTAGAAISVPSLAPIVYRAGGNGPATLLQHSFGSGQDAPPLV